MKKIPILLVEFSEHWMIANTLYCLGSDKQFEIHLVSRLAHSAFRFSPYIKSYSTFSQEAPDEAFTDYLKAVVLKTGAKVLVPTNMRGFVFMIQHKEKLEAFIPLIPLPDPWTFEVAANKQLLGNFMMDNKIPTPLTLTDLTGNLEEKLEGFPFPVLLKPAVGAAGKGGANAPGITMFEDKSSLLAFIKQYCLEKDYLVQQFVDGYVMGCNVLYHKGKLQTYTIQRSIIPAKGFAASTGIEFIDNKEVIEMVDQLLSKLNWNGVANIDLIFDKHTEKVMILEVNPRFWLTINGSMKAGNVNFPALACMQALDLPVERVIYKQGRYIPFYKYVVYSVRSYGKTKVNFAWQEIDTRHYFANLLPSTYKMYNHLANKIAAKKANWFGKWTNSRTSTKAPLTHSKV